MTLQNIINAMSDQLHEIFPNCTVYDNEIPRDADGAFFIRAADISQSHGLNRRHERTLLFEVLYFCRADDNLMYYDFAEHMYDSFRLLSVNGRSIHTINPQSRKNESMVYQFTFSIHLCFVEAAPAIPTMLNLEQEVYIRGEK